MAYVCVCVCVSHIQRERESKYVRRYHCLQCIEKERERERGR